MSLQFSYIFSYYCQAELFANCVLKIEGDDVTAIEVVRCLDELKETIKMRQQDGFLTPSVSAEKFNLIGKGYNSNEIDALRKDFFGNLNCFHTTS